MSLVTVEQAYQEGFKAGREHALVVDSEKYREQGRNEAWEAAKKIVLGPSEGGLPGSVIDEYFDVPYYSNVLSKYSASEAIEKICAYEQKEAEEIHVGDEVVWTLDNCDSGIVTKIESSENAMWIIKSDGLQICASKCKFWKKTGRTFPEFAKFLKEMQESTE